MNTQEHSQSLHDAIRRIALRGYIDSQTGSIKGIGQTTGYVVKIHTDGDLIGTIDVQEFDNQPFEGEEEKRIGYHEGVFLSAMQDNTNGMVIIPKLYSEVTIMRDPSTQNEYVSMFSHVDIIQLDSHDTITVCVRERDKYDIDDEDGPDIEDLPLTGLSSKTTYTKDAILSEVHAKDDEHVAKQEILAESIKQEVGDNKSSSVMDETKVKFEHGDGNVVLQDGKASIHYGSSTVSVEDGMIHVGTGSEDVAVLGNELGELLSSILNYIGQIKTATHLGMQPPVNVGSFLSLKGQIERFKSKHVKVQK